MLALAQWPQPSQSHWTLLCAEVLWTGFGPIYSIPIARSVPKNTAARVDGRATARHLHGTIERALRCGTVKVSAESAGAVASNMFFESLMGHFSIYLSVIHSLSASG